MWNLESREWNPESKDLLDYLTCGDKMHVFPRTCDLFANAMLLQGHCCASAKKQCGNSSTRLSIVGEPKPLKNPNPSVLSSIQKCYKCLIKLTNKYTHILKLAQVADPTILFLCRSTLSIKCAIFIFNLLYNIPQQKFVGKSN